MEFAFEYGRHKGSRISVVGEAYQLPAPPHTKAGANIDPMGLNPPPLERKKTQICILYYGNIYTKSLPKVKI